MSCHPAGSRDCSSNTRRRAFLLPVTSELTDCRCDDFLFWFLEDLFYLHLKQPAQLTESVLKSHFASFPSHDITHKPTPRGQTTTPVSSDSFTQNTCRGAQSRQTAGAVRCTESVLSFATHTWSDLKCIYLRPSYLTSFYLTSTSAMMSSFKELYLFYLGTYRSDPLP